MTVQITVIGGGVSVVQLVRLLAASAHRPPIEVVLVARRAERLAAIAVAARAAAAAARVAAPEAAPIKVRASVDLAEAATGAAIIVLMVRVGGLAARARDEALATAVGAAPDEGLGVGGAANALRTLPVLRDIGATLRRVNPTAWILNLVAPLGVSTRALQACGLRAVGLCELPLVTERRLQAAGAPGLNFAGFNHMAWFYGLSATSAVPKTREHAGEEARGSPLEAAAVAAGHDRAVVARMGAVPVPYFYRVFDREAGARLGYLSRPGRADELARLSDAAVAEMRAGPELPSASAAARPTPWFDDAVVPAIVALLGGPAWQGFVNDAVGSAAVVREYRALFRRDAVVIQPPLNAPPPPVQAWLRRVAQAEDQLYSAAMSTDPDAAVAAVAAVAALPLPSPLTAAQSTYLVDALHRIRS